MSGGGAGPIELTDADWDARVTGADTGKLLRHLGWRPHIGLDEGLARQVEWQRGVVPRRSTETLVSDDPDVDRAVAFIRENAFHKIRVSDVLGRVLVAPAFPAQGRLVSGSFVTASIETLVSSFVTTTDIPGRTPPVVSRTVPKMVPRVS